MASSKRRSIRPVPKTKTPTPRKGSNEPVSKLDQLISAMRRPKGASIADLASLTGWQVHSVRGAISGTLKKKRGLSVQSTKSAGERLYRISGRP